MPVNTIEEALEALNQGHFIIVMDDEDRENEGDLIIAAEKMTPEKMNFMIQNTSGVVCVAMPSEILDAFDIPLMVQNNTESQRTAFTVSIDYAHGTTTGISAADRTKTILALCNPNNQKEDFKRPGHIFPLRYQKGGVLRRAGHTEASVDLSRLAGLKPIGVICEIVNPDGSMARAPELFVFAEKHGLKVITIKDLIQYRLRHESLVKAMAQATVPTQFGEFTIRSYQSEYEPIEHIVMIKGDVNRKEDVLVRIHSECLTGDVLGSLRCDCGEQLNLAMKQIAEKGEGVLIYLRGHEGRGIGITQKLRAYELQDRGMDTVEANLHLGLPVDARSYAMAGQILKHLQVGSIELLTNNISKIDGLAGYSFKVNRQVPLQTPPTKENFTYLLTKQQKMRHILNLQGINHAGI